MANRMTVHMDEKPVYDIVLEQDFSSLPKELESFELTTRRICIVTDSHVAPLYLEEVKQLIAPCCRQVVSFVFPAGEDHKNLDTVKELYETLILAKFDRNDMLVALGGGVVGDLCGFAASTYLRGISFIQIPTTLLSQVDSSIGGKTGVDFDAYKNMVGAFHMPRLVYENIGALRTLPPEQFSAGMGEVIKHGLIQSRDYYEWLLSHKEAIKAMDVKVLETMVVESNHIKRRVVERDPAEKGDRMLLNFGHTLGHAIEKLKNFELLHGECVALGSIASMYISAKRGLLPMGEVSRFQKALSWFDIPISVKGLNRDSVIETTTSDKKMDSGVIRFILLKDLGQAFVDRTVTREEM